MTGDALHLAQRLQSAASPGEILVGPRTMADAPGVVEAEQIGELELRGLPGVTTAYRAVAPTSEDRRSASAGPTFVGRAHELALLRLLYDRVVAEGRSHLVALVEPPRAGKTRLLEESAGS